MNDFWDAFISISLLAIGCTLAFFVGFAAYAYIH